MRQLRLLLVLPGLFFLCFVFFLLVQVQEASSIDPVTGSLIQGGCAPMPLPPLPPSKFTYQIKQEEQEKLKEQERDRKQLEEDKQKQEEQESRKMPDLAIQTQETPPETISTPDTAQPAPVTMQSESVPEQLPATEPAVPVTFLGEQLYEQGLALYVQEKYQEAIPCFEEAIKQKADFSKAYYQLNVCYLKLKGPSSLKDTASKTSEEATQIETKIAEQKKVTEEADQTYEKVAKECNRAYDDQGSEEFKQAYRKFSEVYDKKFNEDTKLARLEEEQWRLAQIEAERQKREEMSNYLATLSEERRSLFTEIAKYFKGDELENTYNLAQNYNSMSEEELRASLARLEAPTTAVSYQQGEEQQGQEEEYQAKLKTIEQKVSYGITAGIRGQLYQLERDYPNVDDSKLRTVQQKLYYAEAEQTDQEKKQRDQRNHQQDYQQNAIQSRQNIDQYGQNIGQYGNQLQNNQQDYPQKNKNQLTTAYYQEQESQRQSAFQAQQLSWKQQDISRKLKSIESQIRFIPRNQILSEKEIEVMERQNTGLNYDLDRIEQQKKKTDSDLRFLSPLSDSWQIKGEQKKQDDQIQKLKQDIQIQDYQLKDEQDSYERQNYQQQDSYQKKSGYQQQDPYQ